ncbi:TetR/AcrR family transcriptional regulator [Pengzhenrongella sp.]|jgi:TetR/AcrR family transcriptional repressor of nem operon|uniref:TetR/AcrR family transcriptional regulator n=1 Tax=Pengzhenrongella sp. TaxID=2888820 RepID=UPI002F934F85
MPVTEMDTRQTILDTAQRIMAQKGFASVGLTQVLTQAGVPKGSFYYYFSSKDAFGEAMMKNYFSVYLTNMDRIFAEPGRSSGERLMDYWQHFYNTQVVDECQGRCLVVKLAAEVTDLSESMRAALKEGTTAIIDRIERMIVSGRADGSLSIEGTPRTTAEALYDAWLGASLMAKIHRSPDSLDRAMTITRQHLHL